MVGEEECVGDDEPRDVPRDLLFVNENTHEFRNSKGGVSIVELDGNI